MQSKENKVLSKGEGYSPRYDLLDHVRAIAATLVVIFHATAQWRTNTENASEIFAAVLTGTFWLGVQLFFVVSGYCIAAAAFSAYKRSDTPAKHFLVRRLRRIFPPYLAWLAFLCGLVWLMSSIAPQYISKKDFGVEQLSLVNWIGNITLSETWLPFLFDEDPLVITRVGWTLCYELQFYLVTLLVIFLVPKRFFYTGIVAISAIMLLIFIFESQLGVRLTFRGTFLDGRWLQFAVGIWVYQALTNKGLWQRHAIAASLGLFGIVCFLQLNDYSFGESINLREKRILELFVCSLFAAILIWVRPFESGILQFRWLKPLQDLGIASYSLYLVHWPVCKVLAVVCWKLGLRSTSATLFVTTPICMVASLVLTWFFFKYFEKPFINAPASSKKPDQTAKELQGAS